MWNRPGILSSLRENHLRDTLLVMMGNTKDRFNLVPLCDHSGFTGGKQEISCGEIGWTLRTHLGGTVLGLIFWEIQTTFLQLPRWLKLG